MSGRETPLRSFRAGPEWDEAQRIAKAKGENLSAILRDRIREYIEDNQEEQQ
jgi:hypothetical protein